MSSGVGLLRTFGGLGLAVWVGVVSLCQGEGMARVPVLQQGGGELVIGRAGRGE